MLCFDIGVDLQASSYKIELDLISINACLSPCLDHPRLMIVCTISIHACLSLVICPFL